MSFLKTIPTWGVWTASLILSALFFKFCMNGYDYIAYTLAFTALLITIHRFAPLWLCRVVTVLVALGLAYFCFVEFLILRDARTDEDSSRDYLIVLGAAVHGDHPSLTLIHRLEGALSYLEHNPDSTAILSGGMGKGENITEAQCMYDWLSEHGISSDRLITENKATSTKENLEYSFEIIRSRGDEPDGNVTLVSSAYHLYRAKSMAKLLGVRAAGTKGSVGYPIYTLNCYIREAFGVTHLWAFGR